VNVDHVEGQVQLGSTLFAIPLAELVFLPLELDQLLMRGLEQVVALGCILMRIFRHDEGSPLLRFTPDQRPGAAKSSLPQDCGIMTARSARVVDARQPYTKKQGRKPRRYFGG
jgi:hypothetical protein